MKHTHILIILLLVSVVFGRDWVQMRGPNGTVATIDSSGNQNVYISDQTNRVQQINLIRSTETPTTLQSETMIDSFWVYVAEGHTFDSLDNIYIADLNLDFLAMVLDTGNDTIYIDSPIPKVFATSGTSVVEVSKNLAVDGSTTRIEFSALVPAQSSAYIDITGFRVVINDATNMDMGTFGGIAALERGCVLRKSNADGTQTFYGNFKTNGDFDIIFDNSSITQKAPAGEYRFFSEWEIAGQENVGVTIRLGPGESLDFLVSDDLTGNTSMEAYLYGHFVED